MKEKGMMTRLTHAGETEFAKKMAAGVSTPKVLPIYLSSVFSFDDVPSLDAVYENEAEGYVYSRMANPGTDALCQLLAAAEDCGGALAFSSGMAAIITTILANVKAGDHIVAHPVLYGGVYTYLKTEITRFGVEVDFVDMIKEDVEKYIKPNTKLIYTETISNPLMEVMDLPKLAAIAHSHGSKLVVDNTFATPALAKPMEMGADITVYSATKYLGGHSDIVGGAVMASEAEIEHMRPFHTLYGSIMSPFDAWLLSRSLRTLEMRMNLHSANALKVAEFLEKNPKIERVYYPGLSSSPFYERTQKTFMGGRCGGMLSADIIGGEKGASAFVKACETIKLVPSLAGVTTTTSYPAKTSHRALTEEEMARAGISMGQIRFSVGLENIEDILAELDKALKNI
ncbi:MAG: aminotransferase class I/II-fold pyridoxal phosphate-dependent enzyme [Clostridiales bacterium]